MGKGIRGQDWVKIHTAANMIEAHLIRGSLESAAIPVNLKYEVAGQLYGITVDGLSEVKILVPRDLQQEASGIIKRAGDKISDGMA